MIDDARKRPRLWHLFAAVLGAFVLGIVPLLVTVPGSGYSSIFSPPDPPVAETPKVAEGSPRSALDTPARANDTPLEVAPASSEWPSAASGDCPSTDLRVLIIAAEEGDATLPAIRQVLDYLGTPYTVYVANQSPGGLTPDKLSSGCHAYYQGIILTTGQLSLSGSTQSALTDAEWQTLRDYEASFRVRRVAWYAYPTPEYGLQSPRAVDTTDDPIEAEYTGAGADVFSYANSDNPLPIEGVYAYLAETAGEATTPLLTDERGNVLAAVAQHPDGRETLALTFLSNEFLEHNLVLDYGVVNWVTRGLFLGEERVYMSNQIDDLFLPNQIYKSEAKYRITAEDLQSILDWQKEKHNQTTTGQLRLAMGFNAYGTTDPFSPDTLTPVAKRNKGAFEWITHTYHHLDWDELGYATALSELRKNDAWAREVDLLGEYESYNLITPEYSGLENPLAMRAAREAGIRYVVGDNSKPEWDNPFPNAGFPHPLEPSILVIPRYPNNLGFDVSTPKQWAGQYNDRYRQTWGRDLSYEEILDKESDALLSYLLRGDIDPWMFHQANLRAYDGTRTLLTDLIDATLRKYNRLFTLPILNPTQDEIGRKMGERLRYAQAGVKASVVPGESITLRARKEARVPVTGLRTAGAETYGGQRTSYVDLDADQPVTLSLR